MGTTSWQSRVELEDGLRSCPGAAGATAADAPPTDPEVTLF